MPIDNDQRRRIHDNLGAVYNDIYLARQLLKYGPLDNLRANLDSARRHLTAAIDILDIDSS